MAVRLQDPAGLPIAFDLLGKEHDAELADDDIKFAIPKRQSQRVCLPPRHAILMRLLGRGMVEHGLVEVGRYYTNIGGKP